MKTMCTPDYHQNSFVATQALEHMMNLVLFNHVIILFFRIYKCLENVVYKKREQYNSKGQILLLLKKYYVVQ